MEFFLTHQHRWLHELMLWISWLSDPGSQAVLVGLCLFGFILARRFWPDGLTLLIAALGSAGLVYGLKLLFHRPRREQIFDSAGYSFPSGHSFAALVFYGLVAYWLARDAPPPRRRWIWASASAAILLVGVSRMYLGAHYLSDVVAGYAVAIPWLWGCLALPTAFQRRGSDLTPEEKRARYQADLARLREAALFLPNLVKLATRLARDPRVPRSRKIGLALLGAYLAMPFDLIPDFIPVLGVADDIILVSVTLAWVTKVVPVEIVREHWDGETDLFGLLGRVSDTLRRFCRGGREV